MTDEYNNCVNINLGANTSTDESYVAIVDDVNIAGWIHNSANICMAEDCRAMCRLLDFTWHHCRACGLLICKKCIPAKKMIVPHISSTEAVKVCKDCFNDSPVTTEVLNVPIQPVDVIPSDVETKALESLVPVIDSAVDIVGMVENSWDFVEKLYGGVKSLELDSTVIQSVASVVTSVAVDLFPALLDIGRTVPFVGIAAAVGLKLFESTKLMLQNNKKLEELVKLVHELLKWFVDNKDTLTEKPQESATVFMEYVKKLVLHMHKATVLIEAANKRWTASKVLFAETDDDLISNAIKEIKDTRDAISFHSYNVLIKKLIRFKDDDSLNEIRKMLSGSWKSFDGDIRGHLARYVTGSREWMHEVTSHAINCISYNIRVSI